MKLLKSLLLCSILFVVGCSSDDEGSNGPGDNNQGPCELNVPSWLQGDWELLDSDGTNDYNDRIFFDESGWSLFEGGESTASASSYELCQTDSCLSDFEDFIQDSDTYIVEFVAGNSDTSCNFDFEQRFLRVDASRVEVYAVTDSGNSTNLVSILIKQ